MGTQVWRTRFPQYPLVLAVSLLLVAPSFAQALTEELVDNQVRIEMQYTEPSTNADGTPLQDLYRCFGDIDLKGDGLPAKPWSMDARSGGGGEQRRVNVAFDLTPAQADNVTAVVGVAQCEDDKRPPNISDVARLEEALEIVIPAPPDQIPPATPAIQIIITIAVNPY